MTNVTKTEAKIVKDGSFEHLYLLNVPVFYAKVLELSKKYQSEDRAYQFTVFVDSETREKLEMPVDEDGVAINKQLFEVGKDRNKKKKVKFPLESQLKDGEGTAYDSVEGMHGMSLSLDEFTKKGKKSVLKVVDAEGKDWPKDKAIGNNSIVSVKCFGYRNQDEQLVVFPNLVKVVEHVPYEGGSGTGGVVTDDVLGVTVDMSTSYAKEKDESVASADVDVADEDDYPF